MTNSHCDQNVIFYYICILDMARDSHKQWRQCTGTMFLARKQEFSIEIPGISHENPSFRL